MFSGRLKLGYLPVDSGSCVELGYFVEGLFKKITYDSKAGV